MQLNVTLPSGLAAVVERAVASGEYFDADEFVRALVREHQAAELERGRVDRMLGADDDLLDLVRTDGHDR